MTRLQYEVKDGIGWIRFNRPEVLNAFDPPEVRRFVEVLREASADPEVKAIIIGSHGEAFSVGDDLKVALEEYPQIQSGEIHPILDIVEDITENLQEIPRIIRAARKVVIACVRGYAVGAGFEVAIDSEPVLHMRRPPAASMLRLRGTERIDAHLLLLSRADGSNLIIEPRLPRHKLALFRLSFWLRSLISGSSQITGE